MAIVALSVFVPLLFLVAKPPVNRPVIAYKWATTRGFSFQPENPALAPYLGGRPFVGGHHADVQEFITGISPSGRTFCSFIYRFDRSSQSAEVGFRSVVMVRLPAVLPSLIVTPELVGDKIEKLTGGQDIELESERFNQLYRIQSPVEAFAYGVLHPLMMDWLLGPARYLVPFIIEGQDLICWRDGPPDYASLDDQLTFMCALIDQIPQGVIEQHSQPLALS